MLHFGRYDQKIEFVTFGQISDGAGGFNPIEKSELKTWASVEQLRRNKDIQEAQIKLPNTYRVRVQVREGFYPKIEMVVKWRGNNYQMLSAPEVDDVRMGKEWIFDITE